MNERTRAYLYRVLLAAIPLLQAYGIVEDEQVPLIVGLVGAVLATGLATLNTSTDKPQ